MKIYPRLSVYAICFGSLHFVCGMNKHLFQANDSFSVAF